MRLSSATARALRRIRAAICLLAMCLGTATGAQAQEPRTTSQDVLTLGEAAIFLRISPDELKRLAERKEVPARRLGAEWRFSRSALLAWLRGGMHARAASEGPIAKHHIVLEPALPMPSTIARPLTQREQARVTGTGRSQLAQAEMKREGGPEAGGSNKSPTGDAPIGEAPKESTAEEVFLRSQKVLLAPGEAKMDLGFFYSRNDNQTLALVGGGIGLASIEQDTATALILGRVGLRNETELFLGTTYRGESTDVFLSSAKISESRRTELGDVRLGIRHTLLKEGVGRPNVIATLEGRIPTGETSYALGGGLALVKSLDPVVLFANANYRHTYGRDFADITRLEPEDRFDVSLGYALSLNDTLTISTTVSGVFTSQTSFSNATLRRQEAYSLSFGLTARLAEGLYIEPTVSFRLGGPGNSAAFGVTFPYTF